MPTSQQLPLELGHRPALDRVDFLVTDSNREAVGWIDSWPEWSMHCLGLYGPAGCGKTHLTQVFAAKSGAKFLDEGDMACDNPVALVASSRAFVWDGGDEVPNEPTLFHIFNAIREAGKHLLIVGQTAPSRWDVKLPDLKSRLAGMPSVEIRMPDDQTISAVLIKLFQDRQVEIAPDIIKYIGDRIPRTFNAMRSIVDSVDRQALAQKRKVTIPFVRELLRESGVDLA